MRRLKNQKKTKTKPTSEQLFLLSQKAMVFSESLVLVSSQGAILWCRLTCAKEH